MTNDTPSQISLKDFAARKRSWVNIVIHTLTVLAMIQIIDPPETYKARIIIIIAALAVSFFNAWLTYRRAIKSSSRY